MTMSDEVNVDQTLPEAVYSDDDSDFFVEESAVPQEQQQLIAELRSKQAELQAKVDPVEAMKTAIQGLGGQLTPPKAPVDVSVKANIGVQDWNQYKEQFNTRVFEDPFTSVMDIVNKANEVQSASTANQNLAYSKRIVQIDPATKDHYRKWADEVETEVARMPAAVRATNPNVYEDALRIVKANHVEDLIEERMAAERGKVAPAKPASFSESPSARPGIMQNVTSVQKQQVRISQTKMNEINQYADQWGIPEEAAIRLFKQRNWL
jgi:hypothetical protein